MNPSTYTLTLDANQLQVLAGLLDAAIKTIGIRAMEDDVVGLMQTIKNAQPSSDAFPPAPTYAEPNAQTED